MEFYLESYCGKAFLRLIARGSTIVAELLRLSNNIPQIFYPGSSDNSKYKDLLFDFNYLRNIEEYDEKVTHLPDYETLEDNLFDKYCDIIERFMRLFESINRYNDDLNTLVEEIKDNFYAESMDDLLGMEDGKQVLAESYYYLGVILIFLENLIPGPVREQIVTLHVRIMGGQNAVDNIHEICRLTKKTGFIPKWYTSGNFEKSSFLNEISDTISKETISRVNFTEKIFARMRIDKDLVRKIVLIIKDGDIYDMGRNYVEAEHRSFALANQASLLFVLMFFIPEFMRSESAKMREIVDKHFYDNWVVPVFLGYLVDLTYEWRVYDSARKAISNTVTEKQIKTRALHFRKVAKNTVNKLYGEVLLEGYLTKGFVLSELNALMALLRDANTTCRWLMLHRLSRNPKVREIVLKAAKIESILKLLMYSSEFEQILEKFVIALLKQKEEYWVNDKEAAEDNMLDLSEYFSGKSSFRLVKANKQYSDWFGSMANKIGEIDPDNRTESSKKIMKLIRVLVDVEKYDQIDNNLQVRHNLKETRKHLKKMLKVLNLKQRLVNEIRQITDVSYCSLLLKEFVSHMQDVIQQDAKKTLTLRSTFMKLGSIMNTPMNRLMLLSLLPAEEREANSDEERRSVSMYYSAELMKFVKNVLQIIPRRVFNVSSKLASVLTPKIKSMPGEIDQKELREYALFENRLKMAKYSREIAVYTDGIMSMDRYIIGMIEVIPMNILEEGLRRELTIMIGGKLDSQLRFSKFKKFSDFESLITQVGEELDSLKKAVEYIQDMLNIYGLKIWYDEYNKLVSTYIDIEWNYVRNRELPDEALKWASSENQDGNKDKGAEISIKHLKPSENALTFLGRLINALIRYCDPRHTCYIPKTLSFYSMAGGDGGGRVSITMNTIMRIRKCIGVNGLHGVDKLLSFMILSELYSIQDVLKKVMPRERYKLKDEGKKLGDLNGLTLGVDTIYSGAKRRLKDTLDKILTSLEKIGLYYILRTLTLRELNLAARNDSQKIYLLLETLNESLVNEVQNGRYDLLQREELEAESTFLNQLANLSTRLGFADPLNKVYFKPQPLENIPLIMAYTLYNSIDYAKYHKNVSMVVSDPAASPRRDPIRFLYGTVIFMNQYNENSNHLINYFLAHYIKSVLGDEASMNSGVQSKELCFNAHILCQYHIEFIRLFDLNIETFDKVLPTSLINKVKMHAQKPMSRKK